MTRSLLLLAAFAVMFNLLNVAALIRNHGRRRRAVSLDDEG